MFNSLILVAITLGIGIVATMFLIARYHVHLGSSLLGWKTHFHGGNDGEWYHSLESEVRESVQLIVRGSSRGELYALLLSEWPAQPPVTAPTGRFIFRTDRGFEFATPVEVLIEDGYLKLVYGDEVQVPILLRSSADSRRWFSVEAECSEWLGPKRLAFDNEEFSGAARVLVTDVEKGREARLQKLMNSPDLFPPEPKDRTVH